MSIQTTKFLTREKAIEFIKEANLSELPKVNLENILEEVIDDIFSNYCIVDELPPEKNIDECSGLERAYVEIEESKYIR